MATSLTLCLLWLSSLAFSGCVAVNKINVMAAFTNCPAVFQPAVRNGTYTAQFDFYRKHISGIFVFKAMNDTTERVVFMTETGFKFFDFEFTSNTFNVQYIVPNLNKKIIINTLRKDLGYLVVSPVENSKHEQTQSDLCITFKFPLPKGYAYYSSEKKCDLLQKIEVGNDKKKNLVIDFKGGRDNNPHTINIVHQNFKLSILMKQIENQ